MTDGGDRTPAARRPSPWLSQEAATISDREILAHLIDGLDIAPVEPITMDCVYGRFCEVKKDSDSWVKFYLIAVALLLMGAARAVADFNIFGIKVAPAFIPPVAILDFCVCACAYLNFELKMRLYRVFFQGRLDGLTPGARVEMLLRYPLAFPGGKFVPHELRPSQFMLGNLHVLGLLPAAASTAAGWCLAVFGLMALLLYSLWVTVTSPDLPTLVKVMSITAFAGVMIVTAQYLRNPAKPFRYVRKSS